VMEEAPERVDAFLESFLASDAPAAT